MRRLAALLAFSRRGLGWCFVGVAIVLVAGCVTRPARVEPLAAYPPGCSANSNPKCLTIKIFDVGQGSSAFALLPNGDTILFDAGGSSPSEATAINAAIARLMPQGNIKYLVLSHADNDHTNLLNSITKLVPGSLTAIHLSGAPNNYQTQEASTFFGKIYKDPEKKRSGDECANGLKTGISVKVYCYGNSEVGRALKQAGFPSDPTASLYAYMIAVNAGVTGEPRATNAASLVSGIQYNRFKMLFPGDAEQVTQNLIMARAPQALWQQASVYPLAHHGAGTKGSNDTQWLIALSPEVYVTSSRLHMGWYHAQGALINEVRTNPNLAPRLLQLTDHVVFSSNPAPVAPQPQYCYCRFIQSFFSTYTNGAITINVDSQGRYAVERETDRTQALDACPVPNSGGYQYC